VSVIPLCEYMCSSYQRRVVKALASSLKSGFFVTHMMEEATRVDFLSELSLLSFGPDQDVRASVRRLCVNFSCERSNSFNWLRGSERPRTSDALNPDPN
jgi:hypothetical protein